MYNRRVNMDLKSYVINKIKLVLESINVTPLRTKKKVFPCKNFFFSEGKECYIVAAAT